MVRHLGQLFRWGDRYGAVIQDLGVRSFLYAFSLAIKSLTNSCQLPAEPSKNFTTTVRTASCKGINHRYLTFCLSTRNQQLSIGIEMACQIYRAIAGLVVFNKSHQ